MRRSGMATEAEAPSMVRGMLQHVDRFEPQAQQLARRRVAGGDGLLRPRPRRMGRGVHLEFLEHPSARASPRYESMLVELQASHVQENTAVESCLNRAAMRLLASSRTSGICGQRRA